MVAIGEKLGRLSSGGQCSNDIEVSAPEKNRVRAKSGRLELQLFLAGEYQFVELVLRGECDGAFEGAERLVGRGEAGEERHKQGYKGG